MDKWNCGYEWVSLLVQTIRLRVFKTANLIVGMFNLFEYVFPFTLHYADQNFLSQRIASGVPADEDPLNADVDPLKIDQH